MPAAVQRSIIFPSRQRLTFRIVVRPIEIIDSNRLDVADRFEAGGVVAGRQPRDHALERHLPEQIFRVEVLVGGEFDLTGAVEMAGARPGDRDLAAAEHDAALLAAVTCGAARGIVLALGPLPGSSVQRFWTQDRSLSGSLQFLRVRAEMSLPTRTKENRRDGKNDKP